MAQPSRLVSSASQGDVFVAPSSSDDIVSVNNDACGGSPPGSASLVPHLPSDDDTVSVQRNLAMPLAPISRTMLDESSPTVAADSPHELDSLFFFL
ncbi:hypothetical protein V6N13_124342 [Hibiscus sabdariffa]